MIKCPFPLKEVRCLSYLSCSIPCVPQGIPEVFSWASGGVDHLNGQARVARGGGGVMLPWLLLNWLPHGGLEPGTGLVTKHESGVVVIPLCVDKESPAEVHGIELMVTWKKNAS